jgi:hypothetical protein
VLPGKDRDLLSPIDEKVLRELWAVEWDDPIECHGPKPEGQVLCYNQFWNIFYSHAGRSNFENPLWSSLGSRDSPQWVDRDRRPGDRWPSAKDLTELFDAFGHYLESQKDKDREEMDKTRIKFSEFKEEFPTQWRYIEKEMRDHDNKEQFERFLEFRWERRKRMDRDR